MGKAKTSEQIIIELHLKVKSVQDIRRLTKHSFDKVNNTINYYKQYGVIPDPPKVGRPSHLTNNALTMIAMTILSK